MNSIDNLVSYLSTLPQGTNYRTLEESKGISAEISTLIRAIMDETVSPLGTLPELVLTPHSLSYLRAFAEYMAVCSVRSGSASLLLDSLVAISIENGQFDVRETTISLVLIEYCARTHGLNLNTILESGGLKLLDPLGAIVKQIVDKKKISLDSFGLTVKEAPFDIVSK